VARDEAREGTLVGVRGEGLEKVCRALGDSFSGSSVRDSGYRKIWSCTSSTQAADGTQMIQAPFRRVGVTSARAALIGFQHGRCSHCQEPLTSLLRDVHVDPVYPLR
jgi:hypothetical protein